MRQTWMLILMAMALKATAATVVYCPINYANRVLSASALVGYSYYNPNNKNGRLDLCSGLMVSKTIEGKRRYLLLTVRHPHDSEGYDIKRYLIALATKKLPSQVKVAYLPPNKINWTLSDSKYDMAIADITNLYDADEPDTDASPRFVDLDSIGSAYTGSNFGILTEAGVAWSSDFERLDISRGTTKCLVAIANPVLMQGSIAPYETNFNGIEGILTEVNCEAELHHRQRPGELPNKHIVHKIALPNKDGFSGGGVYALADEGHAFLIGIVIGGSAECCDIMPIEHIYELIDQCVGEWERQGEGEPQKP